eukprot:559695-Pyramimonas_sp.AAC.1
MDRGLDSAAIAAAPGKSEDASGGSGGVGLVDVDAPPDFDPDDAEIEVPVSATERLKKSAASLSHLLTRAPKNPCLLDV